MALPTFMVVGAQKAATTWLSECLDEHPEIFVPPCKEVHFFCPAGNCRVSTEARGLDWYLSLFPEESRYRVRGELSTDYMFFPEAAEALHRLNPDMKVIFMLRHPVDRAYSAYWMQRRKRTNLPPFETVLEQRPDFITRGLYHEQIDRFLRHFPREQIRIYLYEDMKRDPDALIGDLYAFLGADPAFRPRSMGKRIGASRPRKPWAAFLIYRVLSPIINLPVVLPVWRFLRRHTRVQEVLIRAGQAKGTASTGYPKLSAETRARLLALFAEENERLFALLGRRIPEWSR